MKYFNTSMSMNKIKATYREWAFKLHSDVNGGDDEGFDWWLKQLFDKFCDKLQKHIKLLTVISTFLFIFIVAYTIKTKNEFVASVFIFPTIMIIIFLLGIIFMNWIDEEHKE